MSENKDDELPSCTRCGRKKVTETDTWETLCRKCEKQMEEHAFDALQDR